VSFSEDAGDLVDTRTEKLVRIADADGSTSATPSKYTCVVITPDAEAVALAVAVK
jgi:hypothetical protein